VHVDTGEPCVCDMCCGCCCALCSVPADQPVAGSAGETITKTLFSPCSFPPLNSQRPLFLSTPVVPSQFPDRTAGDGDVVPAAAPRLRDRWRRVHRVVPRQAAPHPRLRRQRHRSRPTYATSQPLTAPPIDDTDHSPLLSSCIFVILQVMRRMRS
jgi:hypothetical protein